MKKTQNTKRYDLEERTLAFAKKTRDFTKDTHKSISNFEYSKQLIRSSSSVGANYIEANESLSKKDFIFRVKICRKEAKESRYWLELIEVEENSLDQRHKDLLKEAIELMMIFGSIIRKLE